MVWIRMPFVVEIVSGDAAIDPRAYNHETLLFRIDPMTDEKEPLVQDEVRSTKGGPQSGVAFMIIVAAAVLIALAGALYAFVL